LRLQKWVGQGVRRVLEKKCSELQSNDKKWKLEKIVACIILFNITIPSKNQINQSSEHAYHNKFTYLQTTWKKIKINCTYNPEKN
jgi:hypothetical protein